jgi:pyrroline-5-carboxylate reductase
MMKMSIIGCGNMASALVSKMSSLNQVEFLTYTPTYTRAKLLAEQVHGTAVNEASTNGRFS